jgi:hypothetical protein
MVERAATATRPFQFTGCVELREILGRRARDERELMEEIEGAPAESIYYHTDSVFLRRPLVAGSYPNDFAIWVATQIRDQVLAERLGMVDPFQFESVERTREELLSILDDHLEGLNPVPQVVFGDPFFFVRSHLIEVPTGISAGTLPEFRAALAEVDSTPSTRARGAGSGAGSSQSGWARSWGSPSSGSGWVASIPISGGSSACAR